EARLKPAGGNERDDSLAVGRQPGPGTLRRAGARRGAEPARGATGRDTTRGDAGHLRRDGGRAGRGHDAGHRAEAGAKRRGEGGGEGEKGGGERGGERGKKKEENPPAAPAAPTSLYHITATADFYWENNFNNPFTGKNALRAFDIEDDEGPHAGLGEVSILRDRKPWGFRLVLAGGETSFLFN